MSVIIREMQIKPQGDTTSHQSEWLHQQINQQVLAGCGEKGTRVHCWWECRLVQPLWEAVWT